MGKHGRNATANPVYSSAERRKDSKQEGYGLVSKRLGADSLPEIDHCCLTLQPARNPVVTPDGFLYDKEAILENIIHQKATIARAMKEYERQKTKAVADAAMASTSETQAKIEAFKKQESSISITMGSHFAAKSGPAGQATQLLSMPKVRVQTAAGKVEPALPSFWLPSLTPETKSAEVPKPDSQPRCPMSGRPIKVKDLVTVHLTPVDPTRSAKAAPTISVGGVIANANPEERFMCPITQTVLRKGIQCYVLRPSGRVVTAECVEKIIRPDMRDPISSDVLTERDLIPLQRSGTGFAGSGAQLEVSIKAPSLTIS